MSWGVVGAARSPATSALGFLLRSSGLMLRASARPESLASSLHEPPRDANGAQEFRQPDVLPRGVIEPVTAP